MGFFKKIARVIIGGALGGPAGALTVFTVEHKGNVIEGTIDTVQQIVKIGKDVYKAIPPEAIALGGFPIHGLLKHEFEDELILLGEIAGDAAIFSGLYWPALGPVGATLAIAQGAIPLYVAVGSIIGKIHHRLLNDEEWEMAKYVFRDSLFDRSQIILTNLAGKDDSAFVYPTSHLGSVLVNMGPYYVHNATTPNGPLLLHELTHVWQAKRFLLREIFLHKAIPREYNFTPGQQWSTYNIEQQASIVEAWADGVSGVGFGKKPDKFSINTPLFRYINGNIRRSNNKAKTGSGNSVRQLLKDGTHKTMKEMHNLSPRAWWT